MVYRIVWYLRSFFLRFYDGVRQAADIMVTVHAVPYSPFELQKLPSLPPRCYVIVVRSKVEGE